MGSLNSPNSLNSLKTMRWTLYFTGGVLVLLGFWAMTYPVGALMSLALFLGIGFILSGINHLTPCFSLRGDPLYPRWMLFQGILDLLLGGVMLARLGLTAFMIPLMVAAWFCVTGIVRVVASFRLRAMGFRGWWRMLLNGLFLTFCAFLMAASPFVGGVSVALMMGSALVVSGALMIMEGRWIFS